MSYPQVLPLFWYFTTNDVHMIHVYACVGLWHGMWGRACD